MPVLVTFRGRPVKRRYRAPNGMRLVLFHPDRGVPGERLIVSQNEWKLFGLVQVLSKDQMPDVRALAAARRPTPTKHP